MRRALILTLVGLTLFAGAALAGFYVAARVAPERLRIETERRLSKLLDAPVRVQRTEISLQWGLVLELKGVDVGPTAPGDRLRVERLSARLDPVSLLMARFRLDQLALDGASLSIERSGRPGRQRGEHVAREAIAAIGEAARSLLARPLSIRTVELRGGSVRFTDSTRDEPFPISFEAVSALARRVSFRRRAELRLSARIRGADGRGGSLLVNAAADETVRATLTFRELDLAILAPYAPLLGIEPDLGGVAEGNASWEYRPGQPQTVNVRLDGSGLRASVLGSTGKRPFEVTLEHFSLAARAEASPDALRLQEGEISDGRVTLRADGSLALPIETSANLRLAVQLEELPLVRIREVLSDLPPELREWLDPLSQRVEAGRLLDLRAEVRTTLAGFRELVESRLMGRPGEITVRAEIADAALRVGKNGRRLESLSGRAIWSGEDIELRNLRARLGERALPRLNATVRGLANIRSPSDINCIPPSSKASLPGFGELRDWIRSRRKGPRVPTWKRVTIDADWILHAALLCSLENAFAEITPAQDGFDFALQHGVWAGVPVQAKGSYRRVPELSVSLEMSLGPPFEAVRLDLPAEPWAKGRWETELTRLGEWSVRGASGKFQVTGTTLRLEESTLFLAPLGEVEGNAEIALGGGGLPFRIETQVRKMDLVDLANSIGREQELLSGQLLGAGVVSGRLIEGLPLLADAEGLFSLHARDGMIHQELPPFVAIAVASDRFNPFRSRDEISYTAIDLVARIEAGQIHSESLTLYAPSLRMVGSGQVATIAPHDVEAVVGVFFFRTLDSLINRVPVLNRVILGRNENLVGAYFAMNGSWKEPKAQLIPLKSFAEGPAHFMLEGLPLFVWSGLKRIESLLNPWGGPHPAPEEARPDS